MFRALRNHPAARSIWTDGPVHPEWSNLSIMEKPAKPARKRNGPHEPLDPHGEIGSKLRALFAEVEKEPIPPKLIELLEKLAEAEKQARR